MTHYTDIDTFLDMLAAGADIGTYQKSTFPNALCGEEWARLAVELDGSDTPVKQSHIALFQHIGILTKDTNKAPYTYSHLASDIKSRLELIAFAKEHIRAFTTPRH